MSDEIDIGQEIENGFHELGGMIEDAANTAGEVIEHFSPILLPLTLLGAQQVANQNGKTFDPWQNPYANENNEGTKADEPEKGTPSEEAPKSTTNGPVQEPSGEPVQNPEQPAPPAGSRGGTGE